MERKVMMSALLIILLSIIVVISYYKVNYKSLDEAIRDSNVPIDETFLITEDKGHTIIFYGVDDILSVGLVEKNHFGYRWVSGVGSELFNVEDLKVTRTVSNLQPRGKNSNEEYITLTFGVINDDSIEEIWVKYKDVDFTEATILETSKGRIWYCFSETPVNYDPDVKIIYSNRTTKTDWH